MIIKTNKHIPAVKFDKRILLLAVKGLLCNAALHGSNERGVRLNNYVSGAHVHFVIRDWGQGMIDTQLAELFSRRSAKQSNHTSSGLGMGLHLLQRLINTGGGMVRAYSKPQVGTLMVLSLPR